MAGLMKVEEFVQFVIVGAGEEHQWRPPSKESIELRCPQSPRGKRKVQENRHAAENLKRK